MRAMLRNAKADGSAVWGLLGLSFLYGIFHAAGPGHGKAVISSYVVANHETWRRGVVLSFASALLQAFVAVAFVGHRRLGVQCHHGDDVHQRALYRDRQLCADRADRAAAGLGEGPRVFSTWRGMSRPLHAVGAAVTPPLITSTAIIITTTSMTMGTIMQP